MISSLATSVSGSGSASVAISLAASTNAHNMALCCCWWRVVDGDASGGMVGATDPAGQAKMGSGAGGMGGMEGLQGLLGVSRVTAAAPPAHFTAVLRLEHASLLHLQHCWSTTAPF